MAFAAWWVLLGLGVASFGAASTPFVERLPLRPAVKVFNDRDGLPQNSIEVITLDAEGFLWVGTQNGAARYDGRTWSVVDLPTPQRSNWVGALLPRPDGLYVGTIGDGLHRWQGGQWTTFRSPLGQSFQRIHYLAPATKGGLWVGTQDEGLWHLEGALLDRIQGLPGRRVKAVLEEGDSLWAGTEAGVYLREAGTWTQQGPRAQVNDLLRDGPRLWMATTIGLFRKEGSGPWQAVPGLPGPEINRLIKGPGPRGKPGLWVATNKGVACLEGDHAEVFGLGAGLPSLACPTLFIMEPDQGLSQVWAGTFAGLTRWTFGKWNSLENGPAGHLLFAIAETTDGSIWAGSMGGGLFRFQSGQWSNPNMQGGASLPSVLSLAPSPSPGQGGRLWVGSRDQGVAVWEHGALRWWEHNAELPNLGVFALLATQEGASEVLWIGTRQGLSRWDGRTLGHFGIRDGLPHPHVTTLLDSRTKEGEPVLWIGTRGGGVARLIHGRIEPLRGDGGQAPMVNGFALARDLEGRTWLWVAYGGGGAWRLDPENPTAPWRHLTQATPPALPSDLLYQVRADGRGRVFFFTSKGVARLDPQPGGGFPASLPTYTTGDGLPSNGCTMGSSWLDRAGRLWTGTVAGGAFLDLALDQDDAQPKPLRLLRSQAAGWIPLEPGAELDHNQSRLAFEFALLDYHRENDVRYCTQLLGLDSEPTPWRPEGRLEYPVLPSGRYTLKIWGRDHAGNVSGPLAFPFRIRPAPWMHPAARLGYALGFIGLAWVIHLWRSRWLLARNLILQSQVDSATLELRQSKQRLEFLNEDLERLNTLKNEFIGIAAHDLRNPLTGLLLQAEMLQEETDGEQLQEGLSRIKAQGRVLQELISRLLNANAIEEGTFRTEMQAFDLSPLVWEAVVQFEGRAQQKEIRMEQDIPLDPMMVQADPHLVREVVDNLLSNALKFSPRGTRVLVRLQLLDRGVCLSVEDQGPGLTADDKAHLFGRYARLSAQPSAGEPSVGLGLFIVKQMVDTMRGTIDVVSEPGQGACFRVQLESPAVRARTLG